MTDDFKHVEEQIAWLDSVIAVFTLDCEPRQNLVKARDTMQAMLDEIEKLRDPDWTTYIAITETWLEKYPPDIFTGVSGDSGPLFVVAVRAALDKLKAEKVIDAAENGRGCNQPPQKVSDSRNRSEK